jgi:hypothetical protein
MDTLRSFSKRSCAFALGICLVPFAAAAQTTLSAENALPAGSASAPVAAALPEGTSLFATPALSAEPAQAPAGSRGPMVVERVKSGFLVEPEVKVTRFDHRTSELVGADAGWLADQTFFIGGGGYWLTDWSRDRQLAYGGLVLGVTTPADNPFSVGFKALIGGGQARVTRGVTIYEPFDSGVNPSQSSGSNNGSNPRNVVVPTPVVTNVRFEEDFVVFEPEVTVGFKMSKHLRITAGAGYRWLGNRRDVIDGLNGPTGSVGLQILGNGR